MKRRKSRLRLLALNKEKMTVAREKALAKLDKIILTNAEGVEYEIEDTPENRILVNLAESNDKSQLNVWSKANALRRHFKRIKHMRRHKNRQDY